MWERLKERVLRWLGIQAPPQKQPVDEFVRHYEDITSETITATISNKLAMLTYADSTIQISDADGRDALTPRAQLIADAINDMWTRDASWITAQAYGKGGIVLVPVITARRNVVINAVDQNRMVIIESEGSKLKKCVLIADELIEDDVTYQLMASYELSESGVQLLKYRAMNEDGAFISLGRFPRWAGITPEISIEGTDRLLLAYLRCPRDNRTTSHEVGVPITYGVEGLVEELAEHARIYKREYKLTRPMLGLDSTLWRDPNGTGGSLSIDTLRRTVQDEDDPFVPFDSPSLDGRGSWQYYAPSIRYDAMEMRYASLCRRVEKACGLSQGILTERQTMNYANKDEVRAAMYDTFSVIRAMRQNMESVINDLAYAVDVLAERFGLTEAGARGQYTITFDWDMSLIESTAETFAQNMELQGIGAVSKAEMRQWVRGGTLEENQQAIDEIAQSEGGNAIDQLLNGIPDSGEE